MPQIEQKVPLVLLGGSDRRGTQLPPEGQGKHSLSGCKAVDIHIDGRRLIELVLERFRMADFFEPIYIVGPAQAYSKTKADAEVFDSDDGFGRNIQVGIDEARKRHPEGPLAIATSDILPTEEDLNTVIADYRKSDSSDLWYPVVRAPKDEKELGASSWKPRYQIREGDNEPASVLPGHLVIFDPDSLRLQFLYHLVDLGYQSRNRPILYRRSFMIRQLVFRMIWQDLLHIAGLRLPTFTWDTLKTGGTAALRLRNSNITRSELEGAARQVFCKRTHRKRFPDRSVHVPILDAMSFARDIDTLEEAAAVGGTTE